MSTFHLRRSLRPIVLAAITVAFLSRTCFGQGSQYVEVIPLSDLDFATVTQASSTISVGTDYLYIGKFKVRARLALPPGTFPEVDLTFVPPSTLGGPGGGISYSMTASTNSQADNPATSSLTSGTTARITLEDYEGSENGLPVYSAYAYVFGSIDVGAVSSGDYVSPLLLEVEPVLNVPPVCQADPWRRRKRYYPGDIVTHDGAAWEANRFTIGNEPGQGGGTEEEDGDGNQVTICHIPPGNPSNQQTLSVGQPAVQAHLDHGDYVGACSGGGAGGGDPWDLISLCP